MERIASFSVDHRSIRPGIYVSRVDGDVTTYDLRTRTPNAGDYMDNGTMHSVEHLLATLLRSSELSADILYFGPMGCQTGFYLLVRNADHARVLQVLKAALADGAAYSGELPGSSEAECGNYRTLSTKAARAECARYYETVRDWTPEKLRYDAG